MTKTNNLITQDELDWGQWITLKDVQIVPLEIEYFWSAFDNYLEFLKGFSGRTNVELETDDGKPTDRPGAIVRFDFQGSLVRDRLLYNDRQNHVWKMDIPEATNLFTLYVVTISARKIDDHHTEVSITVELVLQSHNREERAEALQTLKAYLPKRIAEIIKFLQHRDGEAFKLAPLSESEIRQLAKNFYTKIDQHVPASELVPFFDFANHCFKMQFPSSTLQNQEEFNQWYEGTINTFFDEIHAVKEISVKALADHADVNAIIHWEGSTWKAPSAHSKRVIADAQHTWVVVRSPDTFKPIYKSYIVHKLDFAADSSKP
ncbi:hypothetical protein [Dendronalium sp. ChiSLP03b]|uniref:hypothetical protein n=1 Tax=Dendronalium sp. ChiSLP03b TaxID=3075381 RepID=UPI002AD52446|nr:hypothetical protein [Dendronalium sp. ChiSLP03b]MDZ8209121.1 hypothetical protein [Dendronalium sp. ChiSLP03b]